jgi:hypothetical protein
MTHATPPANNGRCKVPPPVILKLLKDYRRGPGVPIHAIFIQIGIYRKEFD